MLKFLGVIVGILLLLSGACSPMAHAASTNVMITHIQAGGVGVATQELVIIYNNSPNEIDITDWCLVNKSNVAFACFGAELTDQILILPGYSYATAGTSTMATALGFSGFTVLYTPTSQSSGSIVGSSDTIKLVDAFGSEVDKQSWASSLSSGMVYTRHISQESSQVYVDTDTASDWSIQQLQFMPVDQTERRVIPPVPVDVCPNIPDVQLTIPVDRVLDATGDCIYPVTTLPLAITELLPNADGSDTDHEFIELYNPNDVDVDLGGYRLWVGPSFEKSYAFPDSSIIVAHAHKAFTNTDIKFSLLNTLSRVRVTTNDGSLVDEVPAYQDPKDDMAWALVSGTWQYTNQPTPGAANVESSQTTKPPAEEKDTRKPCASNQFRNPATGRCKLLTSASGSALKPCNANQYRNKETNRCRNLATVSTGLKPCKEGQERNPDTNRCRTITKMPTADYAVLGAQSTNNGTWYIWAAIGGVLLLAIGYAVWEWRQEIAGVFQRLRKFVRPAK